MLKIFVLLCIPFLLLCDSRMMAQGKKIYKSVSDTVHNQNEIIRSSMGMDVVSNEIPTKNIHKSKTLSPKEREAFVKKQFISKDEIFEVKTLQKEEINTDIEAIDFFNSLNEYKKKPIDIE